MKPAPLPLFAKRPRAIKQREVPVKELQLHISVVAHLRYGLAPGWLFFHVPNGELRDKRVAAKLKAMGVLPGVPDLVFVDPLGRVRFLELKRPKSGRLSTAQDDFRTLCRSRKWTHETADDIDRALDILRGWGALSPALKDNVLRANTNSPQGGAA